MINLQPTSKLENLHEEKNVNNIVRVFKPQNCYFTQIIIH